MVYAKCRELKRLRLQPWSGRTIWPRAWSPQPRTSGTLVGGRTESVDLSPLISRGLLALASVALLTSIAQAQAPQGSDAGPGAPIPYVPSGAPAMTVQYPSVAGQTYLSEADRDGVTSGLAAARRGDVAAYDAAIAGLSDPVARKIVLWAMIDANGEKLAFFQLDQARRDLAGWPRGQRRQVAAEKTIETSGLDPQRVVDWFGGAEPTSAQGAMALAAAYQQLGRKQDAHSLIVRWWRNRPFEAEAQRAMQARFSGEFTPADYVKREDTLLYGQQGPAAHDLLALLPADQQALAEARMALRNDSGKATTLVGELPASVASDPGLAVERARYLQRRNLDELGLQLVSSFPADPPNEEAASAIWKERRLLINSALRNGDYRNAYAAATHHGMTSGQDFAEAEFYAGWIALSKLHDPLAADDHFAKLEKVGASPITLARALYWRGRAAEAAGDIVGAKDFYAEGGRYYTTFYGQLAAERAGVDKMVLGHDPEPTAADRARFEGRDLIRAARYLAQINDRDLFRAYVLAAAENLPNGEESALLVDMAKSYGDQDLAMRVVRSAAQHGFVLPDRGYPMRSPPNAPQGAETALVFGITRQESGFDPRVRSGPGARGMMQLMPATARSTARRIGEPFSSERLDDPDYNMRLGSAYLGGMVNDFSGSYVMAVAAYNAGPGRPAQWVSFCGDPRASAFDPADFIECIPFQETRNYVMRVLEATEVYRARLNGGTAPISLSADLKRGTYVPGSTMPSTPQAYTPLASVTHPR
jgi:soluble lytic murein transglycosylase